MINCYSLLHYVLQLRNKTFIILNDSKNFAYNQLIISTKINYEFIFNLQFGIIYRYTKGVTLYVIYSKIVPLFYHFYWVRIFYPNKLNRMKIYDENDTMSLTYLRIIIIFIVFIVTQAYHSWFFGTRFGREFNFSFIIFEIFLIALN